MIAKGFIIGGIIFFCKSLNPRFKGWITYKDYIEYVPTRTLIAMDSNPPKLISRLRFNLGLRFHQDWFIVDRLGKLAFVLALEDSVRSKIIPVYRFHDKLKFIDMKSSSLVEDPASIAPSEKVETCFVTIVLGMSDSKEFRQIETKTFLYDEDEDP